MPIRLVAERVNVNPARGRLAGQSLPPPAAVAVRDGDLEAVGREPAGVIEVFIAIASAASRTLHHYRAALEIAHDSVGAGIGGRSILADVSEEAPIRRDEQILVRRPDVVRYRACFDAVLSQT
jgi:hypothetical protein